jgi:hypothetical protein
LVNEPSPLSAVHDEARSAEPTKRVTMMRGKNFGRRGMGKESAVEGIDDEQALRGAVSEPLKP